MNLRDRAFFCLGLFWILGSATIVVGMGVMLYGIIDGTTGIIWKGGQVVLWAVFWLFVTGIASAALTGATTNRDRQNGS